MLCCGESWDDSKIYFLSVFNRGKEQKLNLMSVFHSFAMNWWELNLFPLYFLFQCWPESRVGDFDVQCHTQWGSTGLHRAVSLVSGGLRWKLNDSFEFLHPGSKARMVKAGWHLQVGHSPHIENLVREQNCHPHPEYLYFVAAHINFPLNFLVIAFRLMWRQLSRHPFTKKRKSPSIQQSERGQSTSTGKYRACEIDLKP